jgi:hypothetical protein
LVHSETGLLICAANLDDLFGEARQHLFRTGKRGLSPRGETLSLNNVTLVWKAPHNSGYPAWSWREAVNQFYQSIFVQKNDANRPEAVKAPGDFIFPYTYSARSRYWDGGWGYAKSVVEVTRQLVPSLPAALHSIDGFNDYLSEASEYVHLQTLLAVWNWIGVRHLATLIKEPHMLDELLARNRLDQLDIVVDNIADDPCSRRAITSSLLYPSLDFQLRPAMGVPAYQIFQLLPAQDGSEPISSLHYHRSLDLGDGIVLDYYHDLQWLAYAAGRLQRAMGSITIVSGNLHLYVERSSHGESSYSSTASLLDWLFFVTDGYRAGSGSGRQLLNSAKYRRLTELTYNRVNAEQ